MSGSSFAEGGGGKHPSAVPGKSPVLLGLSLNWSFVDKQNQLSVTELKPWSVMHH